MNGGGANCGAIRRRVFTLPSSIQCYETLSKPRSIMDSEILFPDILYYDANFIRDSSTSNPNRVSMSNNPQIQPLRSRRRRFLTKQVHDLKRSEKADVTAGHSI